MAGEAWSDAPFEGIGIRGKRRQQDERGDSDSGQPQIFCRSAPPGRREPRIFSRQDAKLAKVRVYFPTLELVFLGVLCAFAPLREILRFGCDSAALGPSW
jgi:hypothetical protein